VDPRPDVLHHALRHIRNPLQEDLIGATGVTSAYAFLAAAPTAASTGDFPRKSGELSIIDTNYSEPAPTHAGVQLPPPPPPSGVGLMKHESFRF